MIKIVLLRHGESVWNKKKLFTGWTDVDLTARGVSEAKEAGQQLSRAGFIFDVAFTSCLKRVSRTLDLVLREMNQENIEKIVDWRLNERHYGNLQGLSKKKMAEKFGEKQVFIWRRSYAVRPPAISSDNKYNQQDDPRYRNIVVPKSESLHDVFIRVQAFWEEEITPRLKTGKRIIISASGNSLRALVKYLNKMTPEEVAELNIPVGIPLVYEFDQKLNPLKHYYLASQEKLETAVKKVIDEGKKD
jgi:2,3-bisphosphoglycerate-dependent phosphoglycerate mutase